MKTINKIKKIILLTAALSCVLLFVSKVNAATVTWDGGGGNANWSTAANWVGDVMATTTDIAYFDGTCSSNCSPNIDIPVTVQGITMTSGYSGTITQGSGKTITLTASNGFNIAGGTFVGGDSLINLTSGSADFIQSGGTFTNSSGGLSLYRNITLSGGTFNNSYNITLIDTGTTVDSTVSCSGTLPGTLVISKSDLSGTASDVTIESGCTVSLGANPTSSVAILTNNGTIGVSSGTWTINSGDTYGLVNAGTVNHSGTGWTFTSGSLTNNVGGTINYTGTAITIERSLTINGGTPNLSGKTITFTNTGGDNTTISCTGTLDGTVVINKASGSGTAVTTIGSGCTINLGASPTTASEGVLTNNGTIVVDSGTWTYSSAENAAISNNGTITHNGNGWDINDGDLLNNTGATITYSGTLIAVDQDFTQSGTFDLTGKTIDLTTTGGSDSSTVTCSGNLGADGITITKNNSSGTSAVVIAAGCSVVFTPNSTNSIDISLTNNGTVTIPSGSWTLGSVETSASLINNGTFTHSGNALDINLMSLTNNGTMTYAGSSIDIDDSFTQNGTFDLTGKTVNFTNGASGGRSTTISCTGSLGGTVVISKTGTSGSGTVTIASGCSINLGIDPTTIIQSGMTNNGTIVINNGTWNISRTESSTFTNAGTITHNGSGWNIDAISVVNTGTITYSGTSLSIEDSFTQNGTFDTTGKTIVFDGAGSASDTTLVCGSNIKGNITINKTDAGGTFTLGSNCIIEGDFTKTDGVVGNSVSPYTLEIQGNFSMSTADAFGGANLTFKLGGGNTQTITQNAGTILSPLTIDKTAGTATLATNLVVATTTVTSGTLDQGATFNLTINGDLTVGVSGIFSNTGTGDLTLGGNVSNAGVITINGSGEACGDADSIVITATSARTWSGAGVFTLKDVALTNQTASVAITINSGTNTSGNTGSWTWAACSSVSISGTLYSDEGSTVLTTTPTVRIKINGAGDYSAVAAGDGTYSVSNVDVSSAGVVITAYLDGATEKAATVTRAADSTSNITGLNLYQNRIIVRHEDAGPITNTNLDQYDSDNDTDIQFNVTGGSLVASSTNTLYVWTGKTFTPGGDVTSPNIKILGTYNNSTNNPSLIITGNFTNTSSGVFTKGTGSMKFKGGTSQTLTDSNATKQDLGAVRVSSSLTTGTGYCSSSGNTQFEHIDKVVFGDISRTSGADSGGYYDGTAMSTTVVRGQSYTLTYSPGFASSAFTEYWKVFIDWNGDGDFADVNETAFAGFTTNLQTGDNTTSITVPSDAVSGSFRMRVSMKFNVFSTSCETITEGEVEDYTINISGGSATTLTQGSDVLLSTLTVDSNGTFSQGATYSLTTSGTLSVGSGGTFSNIGTGDLVLGGNVSNAGTMILNSNNSAQCTDSANDIAITSTVGGTQRTWSGAGTFTMRNLNVTDQLDGDITITVYTSTLSNTDWTVGSCQSVNHGGGGGGFVPVESSSGGGTIQTGGGQGGGATPVEAGGGQAGSGTAPTFVNYVAEAMSGTSKTLNLTATAGNTLLAVYLYGQNRTPNVPTIGGVAMTEVTHANTPGNEAKTYMWYVTGASGGSTTVTFTTAFSTSAYVAFIEIGPSTLDTSDPINNSSSTSHPMSDGINASANSIIFAIGSQDSEIRTINGTPNGYTRLNIPTASPAQVYMGYKQTTVPLTGEVATWTTDNPVASPNLMASFKSPSVGGLTTGGGQAGGGEAAP